VGGAGDLRLAPWTAATRRRELGRLEPLTVRACPDNASLGPLRRNENQVTVLRFHGERHALRV
jgi:hypothetical protein